MFGTILNAAAIVVGGGFALLFRRQFSATLQGWLKVVLGVAAVWFGLKLTWVSVHGPALEIARQLAVVLLAMMLGRLAGRGLRLQKMSNRLGQVARAQMERCGAGQSPRFGDGFNTCTMLFCAAPLAVLGAVQAGLANYAPPLLIKAAMDGLAAMAFASAFGWSVVGSAVPVLAWQGTLTLLAGALAPWLTRLGLVDSINATGGMLVFCVALVILGLKRIELADYLPSLVLAPLITWLWR